MPSRNFTYYAHRKMIDLYNNHDHEVGSELYKSDPDFYKDYKRTNCITYVLNSISYGFKKMGNAHAANKVWDYIIRGTDLASYLIHHHDWEGIYLNPDVKNPADGDSEHPYSYRIARKHCTYYSLPVSSFAVNYRPTEVWDGDTPTRKNKKDIAELSNIKFGFGVSRGGTHTWLFSEGRVYEVHWYGIGDDLYEHSSLENDFPWLSSLLIVPPDQAKLLRQSPIRKCG